MDVVCCAYFLADSKSPLALAFSYFIVASFLPNFRR